jgi:hypothetical protein
MSISTIGGGALPSLQRALFSKAAVNTGGQLSQSELESLGQTVPGEGRNGTARAMSSTNESGAFGFRLGD